VVKIRLKRMGTTKRPVYRLVVADSRSPRDGRFIEAIGFYDPLPDPAVVRVDEEKVRSWMRKGARPSDSARQLLVQQGILQATPRPERPASAAAKEPAVAEKPATTEKPAAAEEPPIAAEPATAAESESADEPASAEVPAEAEATAEAEPATDAAAADDAAEGDEPTARSDAAAATETKA
jgi:small subunit ribosomal protein S16